MSYLSDTFQIPVKEDEMGLNESWNNRYRCGIYLNMCAVIFSASSIRLRIFEKDKEKKKEEFTNSLRPCAKYIQLVGINKNLLKRLLENLYGPGCSAVERAICRIMVAAMLAACASLAGCATSYSSSGLAGGYSQERVNERLVKVNFYGNGYITSERVQKFALYRCAEMAREAKKPYFTLYDSLQAAARDRPSSKPRVGTIGGKPIAFAFVALEEDPRSGAYEVSAILAELAPLIQASGNPSGVQP